jgi:hypothetical protein
VQQPHVTHNLLAGCLQVRAVLEQLLGSKQQGSSEQATEDLDALLALVLEAKQATAQRVQ